MKFSDRSVSRPFRDRLAEALPGLADRPDYWRMTQHLLFGTRRDTDTGLLMIPAELIALIEGKTPGQNYSAIRFLDVFRKEVLPFEIEEYILHPNPDRCRCRAVRSIPISSGIEALVKAERRHHSKADHRVWMSTGNAWLRKHAAARRQSDQSQANTLAEGVNVNANTQMLLNYLNNLAPNRFTSALKHLPEAMAAAGTLSDADNQLNLLHAIRDNAQPFYQPAEKTTRVFGMGDSLLRLHRDLRKIMTQDWITADLKSAQLAIVANEWHIPSLTEYLRTGTSIWLDLCQYMGLEFNENNKAKMKRLLYTLIFGAGRNKVRSVLSQDFPNAAAAFRLLHRHKIIRDLVRARGRQMKIIKHEKGAVDAFGYWHDLILTRVPGYHWDYDNTRSILACVAQSYELKLLMPVITLAIEQQFEHHGFTVTTWLHDGFTFEAHDVRDQAVWRVRLALLVKKQAASLGIETGLEFGTTLGDYLS